MSDVRFSCPRCGVGLKVPADQADETIECPRCARDFTLPAATVERRPVPAPSPRTLRRPDDVLPPRDDDDRRRASPSFRKNPKRLGPAGVTGLLVVVIGLLFGGVGIGVFFAVRHTTSPTTRVMPIARPPLREDKPQGGPLGLPPRGVNGFDDGPVERVRNQQTRAQREAPLVDAIANSEAGSRAAGAEIAVLGGANGHKDMPRWLAFSPDGKLLASASQDKTVIVWELPSCTVRHRLKGHTDWVLSVAFSPDGKTLASAGQDGKVRVWDIATGERRAVPTGHPSWVAGLEFSPDGSFLASGGKAPDSFRLWDATHFGPIPLPPMTLGHVDRLAWRPDGTTIVTVGGSPPTLSVINARTGAVIGKAFVPDGKARTLHLSPDGWRAVLASGERETRPVMICDLATGKFTTLDYRARHVAFSPDGRLLACGGVPGERGEAIVLWDLAAERELSRQSLNQAVNAVTFSPGGTLLAAALTDKTIKLWAVADLTDSKLAAAVRAVEEFATVSRRGRTFEVTVTNDATDALLTKVAELPRVTRLNLNDMTGLTDAGLAPIAELTDLRHLHLQHAENITDSGMVHLKELRHLQTLDLSDAVRITDAGLVHLGGLNALTSLNLTGTRVTRDGVQKLCAARPNVKIIGVK